MKKEIKYSDISVWESVCEYIDFTKKYRVFGATAVALKRKMDSLLKTKNI